MTEVATSSNATKQGAETEAKEIALLANGKRNLLCGEIPTAVNQLQEACRLLAAKYGDLDDKCGEAYLCYGSALLDLSRMESGVLGNALEGIEEDTVDSEAASGSTDDKVENPDDFTEESNMTGEEREKVSEQVLDAMLESDKEVTDRLKKQKEENVKAGIVDEKETEEKMDEGKDDTKTEEKKEEGTEKEEGTVKKEEETAKKEEETAKKEEETAKKEEETAKKLDGTAKEEDGTAKKGDGTAKKEDGTAKKEDGTAKKEEGTAKKEEGTAKEEVSIKKDGEKAIDKKEGEDKKEEEEESMETDEKKDGDAEGEGEEGEGEEDEGEEGEGDTAEEGEGEEKKEEEDVSNLQIAWETLELAKIIYSRHDTKEMKLKAAQAYLKLGEVGLETEQYDQAIGDLKQCLKIQQDHLEPESRLIAETHYQIGLACSFNTKHDDALEEFKLAVKTIRNKISKLKTVVEEADKKSKGKKPENLDDPAVQAQKEIKDLEEILPDILAKIEDATDEKVNQDRVKQMVKENLAADMGGVTSELTEKTKEKPKDITHLVRKKRKPDEDATEEDGKKQKTENGSGDAPTNGVNGVNGKDAEVKTKTVEDVKAAKEVAT